MLITLIREVTLCRDTHHTGLPASEMSHDQRVLKNLNIRRNGKLSANDKKKSKSHIISHASFQESLNRSVDVTENLSSTHSFFEPNRLNKSDKTSAWNKNSEKINPNTLYLNVNGLDIKMSNMQENQEYLKDSGASRNQPPPEVLKQIDNKLNLFTESQSSYSGHIMSGSAKDSGEVSSDIFLQRSQLSYTAHVEEQLPERLENIGISKTLEENQNAESIQKTYEPNMSSDIIAPHGTLSYPRSSMYGEESKENQQESSAIKNNIYFCRQQAHLVSSKNKRPVTAQLIVDRDGHHRLYAFCSNPISCCWERKATLHINQAFRTLLTDENFQKSYHKLYHHITSRNIEKQLYTKWCLICDRVGQTITTQSKPSINEIVVSPVFECVWSTILCIEIIRLFGHSTDCLEACEAEIVGLA